MTSPPNVILVLDLRLERDIVVVRQRAREIASLVGFDQHDQTRISTAASEIARNAYTYAGGGRVEFSFDKASIERQGLLITISDEGAGIVDLSAILEGRFHSKTGLGKGILGAKRLMDVFEIRSEPGAGTTVRLVKFLPLGSPPVTASTVARMADELGKGAPRDPFAEVRHQNQELLRALQEAQTREAELARLHAQTRELDRLKTEFFANISHELRTPLALILGPVRKRLASDGLNEAERRDLELVERNARLLLRHVNDLLDLSKLDAGRMKAEYAETDLARLGRLVAVNFESLACDRELRYEIDVPESLPAQADPQKIERVLLNLLSNAFKFTPAGGSVRFAMLRRGGWATVEVEDSGPGIPSHLREAVFERFRQLDGGSDRRFGGTGLGLAIAKQLVGLHGGSIAVGEAHHGGGSLFRVELPLSAPAGSRVRPEVEEVEADATRGAVEELKVPPEARPRAGRQTAASMPLVLVVEDNPDMNAFLSETLSHQYRTVAAFDGKEGLEKALELRPDLILCDIMMPGTSGDQLVREVRQRQELQEVPIVLLTAKADDRLLVQLLKEGAQDYLQKPFVAEQLLARIERLVADRRRVAEEIERLQQVSGRLLQADDQERRTIAHELHENVAQYLAALDMKLAEAREVAVSPRVHRVLAEGSSLLDLCCSEIRAMAYALHPSELEFFGLEPAINSHVKSLVLRSGTEVNVEIAPGLGRLPAQMELVLFRIMQEALNSVLSTGRKKATVRVFRDAEEVGLEVSDQGESTPEHSVPWAQITAMQERARILGGQLGISSGDNGTTIRAVLPLAPPRSETASRVDFTG